MVARSVIIFTIINSSLLFPSNIFFSNGLNVPNLSSSKQTLSSRSRSYDSSHRLLSYSPNKNNNGYPDNESFGNICEQENLKSNSKNRRSFLSHITSTVASTVFASSASAASESSLTISLPTPETSSALTWPLGKVAFSLLPLSGTYNRRATIQETIIPDLMWTYDQVQGVVNVNVPVRETVIKLSEEAGGGLWIHNPVAPTPQHIEMIRELEKKHGPVRHIVLGTVALEHKATFGPFAQYFPRATVWLQPGQWSFPINLPSEFTGVTQRGKLLREIPPPSGKMSNSLYQHFQDLSPVPEWTADISYEILDPLRFKSVGAFSESAFFHKKSKTLIVTDAVVSVTKTPPKIIQEDPRAMLFHARDYNGEPVTDTIETREKGWKRMVQFGLVFFPSEIDVEPISKAFSDAKNLDPQYYTLGDGAVPFNLYPWRWHDGNVDQINFDTISKNGELFCPPILTKLILDREPEKTLQWVDNVVSRFDFERIIPGHLNNNVMAGPKEFKSAFEVLKSDPKKGILIKQRPLEKDLALLQKASDILTDFNVVDASKICDGEGARTLGRFAN